MGGVIETQGANEPGEENTGIIREREKKNGKKSFPREVTNWKITKDQTKVGES